MLGPGRMLRMQGITAVQMTDLYQMAGDNVDLLEDLVLQVIDAGMEAEAARAVALPYCDLRNEISRIGNDLQTRMNRVHCPVCRQAGRWRRTEESKQWTDMECSVCMQPAEHGVLDPCFHTLCRECYVRSCSSCRISTTPVEAFIMSLGRAPAYRKWVAENPRR